MKKQTKITKRTKLAYVLAYKDPTYVRTRALLNALEAIDSIQLYNAINTIKGPLRYIETISKLIWLRAIKRPDVYFLGFRGHEILLPIRIITWPKPLIYDEFFNPLEWLFNEHKKVSSSSIIGRILAKYYQAPLKKVFMIPIHKVMHLTPKNFMV